MKYTWFSMVMAWLLKPIPVIMEWWNKHTYKLRERRFRRQAVRSAKFIARADDLMKMLRWSRQKRKHFWRDFTKKHKVRDQFIRDILK